jgi:hypothetical protein
VARSVARIFHQVTPVLPADALEQTLPS